MKAITISCPPIREVVAGKGFIQQHFADLVHCIHGTIEGMSFNERDILGVKLLSLTVNTVNMGSFVFV